MATATAVLALLAIHAARGADVGTLQPAGIVQDAPVPAAVPAGTGNVQRRRDSLMQVNFRGRYLSIPASIMDMWFYDEDDPGANPYRRPRVRGYVLGLEYVLNPNPANWIFYVEYLGNLMGEGYWDDKEDNPEHDDGDWIRPDDFGLWALGSTVAHQVDIVKPDGGSAAGVGLSMLVGGGIGFGFVTGELTQWNPGGPDTNDPTCLELDPAYERVEQCADDGPKPVPGVLPIGDLTWALRLSFGDQANLRLEAGLHDLLYVGMASGVVF